MPALLDGDGGAAGGAHRRKRIGQRRGGDQHGGREVLRSPAVVSASGDAGARSGRRDRTRDPRWLGDARGRTAQDLSWERCGATCWRASYLQADETPVPVQMHDRRGENHQAYLWQYGKPGGETVFDFCLGRGREGPRKFLGQWEGILQTDGYAAYDDIGGPRLVHVGCWAHARRKFVDAVKVNPQDGAAMAMVTRMDALFLIDRDARQPRVERGRASSATRANTPRSGCRRFDKPAWSWPSRRLPKSALGQAAAYTLNMWAKLRRCFDYAEVELSNNLAENSMRPVALGTKELAACGQRAGRAESGGDSFGRGILPQARRAGEGLPRRCIAGIKSANAF